MKKSIFSVPVYILGLYLIIALFSCNKENPITPPPPPNQTIDSIDKFYWHIDTLWYYDLWDMYVADTNNIFFISTHHFFTFKNSAFHLIDMPEYSRTLDFISGFDANNVYFVGNSYYYNGKYYNIPFLKKWNGSSIQTYYINDTNNRFTGILVEGPDDVWVSFYRNKVCHFVNGSFVTYHLDTLIRPSKLFRDNSNNLILFGNKFINSNNIVEYRFKFTNNNFEQIGTDSNTVYGTPIFNVGNDLMRGGWQWESIIFYNNNSWNFLCPVQLFIPYTIGGNARNDLYVTSKIGAAVYDNNSFFVWNGNKWFFEKNYKLRGTLSSMRPTSGNRITVKDNKVYMFLYSDPGLLTYISWFFRGYPK